jgi:hypothetical protein
MHQGNPSASDAARPQARLALAGQPLDRVLISSGRFVEPLDTAFTLAEEPKCISQTCQGRRPIGIAPFRPFLQGLAIDNRRFLEARRVALALSESTKCIR